jgi:HAMP domain-containing protein
MERRPVPDARAFLPDLAPCGILSTQLQRFAAFGSRYAAMSLLLRANLILGISCVLIAAAAGYACHSMLEANAEREMMGEAGLMLDSAVAMRAYTSAEIGPLLDERLKNEFLPQSVPFYVATQNFLKLHEKYPQYAYKEATLNPTNPRDRATDWEADLVQRFRNDASMHELSGMRDTPMGPSLYMARPIRVEAECLGCHSTPSVAPATMIARYGANNGFDWQPKEIVGAQVVSVPFARTADNVAKSFGGFMSVIVCTTLSLWLIANIFLYVQFIRPLRRIARVADTLSLGQSSAEEFPRRGAREITALGASFERMRKSLGKALKLLET